MSTVGSTSAASAPVRSYGNESAAVGNTGGTQTRSKPEDRGGMVGNYTPPQQIPSGSNLIARNDAIGSGKAMSAPTTRGATAPQTDQRQLSATQLGEQQRMLELGQRRGLDGATTMQTGLNGMRGLDAQLDVKHQGDHTTISRNGQTLFSEKVGQGDSWAQTDQMRRAQESVLGSYADSPGSTRMSPGRMHGRVMHELAPRVLDMPRAPGDNRA